MHFRAEIRVLPRGGILDPQGDAVQHALAALGFQQAGTVHVGRLITVALEAEDEAAAHAAAEAMCRQLLANPVTEDFEISIARPEAAAR